MMIVPLLAICQGIDSELSSQSNYSICNSILYIIILLKVLLHIKLQQKCEILYLIATKNNLHHQKTSKKLHIIRLLNSFLSFK